MNSFQEQFSWQHGFIPQVIQILKFNAAKFFDVSEAAPEQDMRQATDLILHVTGGDIALRLRKSTCTFRDFTIRCENCGNITEIDKIRKGFARWYFYGWVDRNNIISEWILVDVNQFRESRLVFSERDSIPNGDGTEFYSYSLDELFKTRCLLAWEIKKKKGSRIMPKRLHDSGLWSKPWFRVLTPAEKCAFQYLIDHCDGAGVWDADFEAAEFVIGDTLDWPALPAKVKDNITVLESGKWWLIDFVDFQCGGEVPESTTNRAHLSYLKQLKKHGLYEAYKGHIRAINGTIYNDNELELDKDNKDALAAGAAEKQVYAEAVSMTPEQHQKLVDKYGSEATGRAVGKLSTYKMAKGKQYKSDYHACLQWVFEAIGAVPLATKARVGPGWKCPSCGRWNTQTGSVCFQCHKDRDDKDFDRGRG